MKRFFSHLAAAVAFPFLFLFAMIALVLSSSVLNAARCVKGR